ncbi:Alpha/Beta hydrolase protein [Trichoderma chlorosporum]
MAGTFQSKEPTVRSADGTLIWAASLGRSAAEAPAIVFVPGFSSSSLTFRKQFESKILLEKYCMITYEPRGQGRSEQPLNKEAYSSKHNAEDFKAVCETFGAKKVILAGWSYGGIIPVDVFANLGSEWIIGIIYFSGLPWRSIVSMILHMSTNTRITAMKHSEIGHPHAFEVISALLSNDNGTVIKTVGPVVDSCFYPPSLESMSYSEYAALTGAMAQQHPLARALLLNEREQDPIKLLEHADTLPVTLIIGEHDTQIVWENVDALLRRHFKKYTLNLVRDAGHSAFWEKPAVVDEAIQSFTDGL